MKREVKKSNFNSYIYTLFLDNFSVSILMVRCKLCKIRRIEKLLINLFKCYIDQSRRSFIRNDNVT